MDEPIKCPKCGSTQITANKKGFSGVKAAAGIIVAGGIGLAAGDIGSNKIIITCLKCGHQFKPGSQTPKKQEPLSLGVFMMMVSIAVGVLIPACGGSWWFLVIMPILGFLFAIFYTSPQKQIESKVDKTSKVSQNTELSHISNVTIRKQKVICNTCKGLNEVHSNYCRICGEEINIDEVEFMKDGNSFEYEKCLHCNKLTPKKSNKCKFCVNCGSEL